MEQLATASSSYTTTTLSLAGRTAPVKKRDGRFVAFDPARISAAIEKAFRAEFELSGGVALPEGLGEMVRTATEAVCSRLFDHEAGAPIEIETIQDRVEELLMEQGHYAIARRYIVYRAERSKARALGTAGRAGLSTLQLKLLDRPRSLRELDGTFFFHLLVDACEGLSDCSAELLAADVASQLYSGMSEKEIYRAMIFAARMKVEREPAYARVAGRLLLNVIYSEVFGSTTRASLARPDELLRLHREGFAAYIERGVAAGRLHADLKHFSLERLAAALDPSRDDLFRYLGLQTIYDRYLLHVEGVRIESPQYFWMRVAMGLAMGEGAAKETRAIEFYEAISTLHFTPSTPTLFNAGTQHPQLSSCFLTTIDDDLGGIFKSISDNARLSKWAGGLGNDWTNVRATGAHIRGTNGESQGIIPFLKVANDTAVAVNQGGKRQGAVCAYLESWHLDIEEFLELRKNTGDDRRRTHDMNTANWIPDLFMKRVRSGGVWTLFSPDEVPELHDLYGKAFEARYEAYEQQANAGELRQFRQVVASDLWRKMLSMIFETGHPWITFKDPSNVRSPQDHVGVVHSSNLCTEILLPTSATETAVCNLGSVNLVQHFVDGALDTERLQRTITTAVRMLDNVIDLNFYPTPEARNSNLRHRPVGLGVMGFQDCLYLAKLSYRSEGAIEFADRSMELISYYAIQASAQLAAERGSYESYRGSKWDRGLLPHDTIALLAEERGESIDVDSSAALDWEPVREAVRAHGIRNSNVMAIAPTATIANIVGVSASIEPTYRNLYVKSNLSGDFTAVNEYLVADLKALGLWDEEMLSDLKYFDGSLSEIPRIPDELRERYVTASELPPEYLIECASRRQKWIDMGQSLNLYIATTSGRALHEMYMLAWQKGLKTTYYLRSVGATQIEKSTLDVNRKGIQPRWMKAKSASSDVKSCLLEDPTCEACQ